ncbi:exopolyphosphatase [Candidatus Poriferisodalis sp.]|uniref:Ppx/GppA phosphatase family protein n=1 Tax=Candidatus Poriferisodalis sp. TaxID=3101277 RepID=UPI003B020421
MSAEPSPGPVAVVDCGTNTTRLLIDDGTGLGQRLLRITGLGRGVDAGGRLRDDAIGRVVDVLGEYRQIIDDRQATAVRAVATSAARDAANGAEFLQRASDALGTDVELLDGDAEAAYGFAGATAGLAGVSGTGTSSGPDTPTASALAEGRAALVLDIGGGSTEFAYGTPSAGGRPDAAISVDMGSVRWTERFLASDPPRPEELSSAISVARLHLDDIDRDHPVIARGAAAARLVGVAGTVTTVAAVEIGLDPYEPEVIDGFVLSRAAAEDVFRTLATERLADRIHNPGLHVDRAPVIVGGCCILVAVMRHWNIDECIVRERDLLDGIAAELREAQASPAAELREAQASPAAELREAQAGPAAELSEGTDAAR